MDRKLFRINFCNSNFCKDIFWCVPCAYIPTQNTRMAACAECASEWKQWWEAIMHTKTFGMPQSLNFCAKVNMVAALKDGAIVGHVLQKIPTASSMFLCWGGMILCHATESKHLANLTQGGLEILCIWSSLEALKMLLRAKNSLQVLSIQLLKCPWSEFFLFHKYVVQVFLSQIAYPFSWQKCRLPTVLDDFRLLPGPKNRGQCHALVTSQGLQTFLVRILAIPFSRRKDLGKGLQNVARIAIRC